MKELTDIINSLKYMFEPQDFCIYIKNLEGLLYYMNPAFVRFAGYSYNAMLYESTGGIFRGNTIQISEAQNDDVKILSGEISISRRTVNLFNSRGEPRVMHLIKTPLKNKDVTVGVLGIAEDISGNFRLNYIFAKNVIQRLSPKERIVTFMYSIGNDRQAVAKLLHMEQSSADTYWHRAKEKIQLTGPDLNFFLKIYHEIIYSIYPD